MELNVVIPSFGLDALLQACLASLENAIGDAQIDDYRIVVVDNGSPVPYQQAAFGCQNLKIVRTDRRVSFSRACNMGAAAVPAGLYLFLNNDVLLHRRALGEMIKLLERPGVGICGARLVYPNGDIQHCGVKLDEKDMGWHIHHGEPSRCVPRHIRNFQAVSAAVLLITHPVYQEVEGFDEDFPFGWEDLDLCLRVRLKGYQITCAQNSDSIHFESTSSKDPNRHSASRKVFFDRWRDHLIADGPREI